MASLRSTLQTSTQMDRPEDDPDNLATVKRGWSIIEDMTDYINAIGRVPGRGTVVLISRPTPSRGILLTTSFVFQEREEAAGLAGVFLELPSLGSQFKLGTTGCVRVQLRPDVFFFSSAKEHGDKPADRFSADAETETLGYTVLACDFVDSSSRKALQKTLPLQLPLMLSRVPDVKIGDEHLLVTHVDARKRKFYIAKVTEVRDNHCLYDDADPGSHFASGGPIFSVGGDFIGIHHQNGDVNVGVLLKDIVKHLFESAMLAPIGIPLLDSEPEDPRDDDPYDPNRGLSNAEVNQPKSILQRQRLMDVGAGDQLVDFAELERHREAKKKPVRETLLPRKHLEVWNEWYTDYRSLVLMLHAFPNHTKMLKLVLTEMTSHKNRLEIHRVSRLGGIGALLEALDSHPYDQELMNAGITALGRISLYDDNKDAIARCDGVAAVCGILREYANTELIQQWATYVLLNLAHDTPRAHDNIVMMAQYGALELFAGNLTRYADSGYIVKWTAQTIGLMVAEDKAYFDIALSFDAHNLIEMHLRKNKEDGNVAVSLLFALHCLTKQESYSPAIEYLVSKSIFPLIAEVVEIHTKKDDSLIIQHAACLVRNLLKIPPTDTAVTDAIHANLEELLIEATTTWLAEPMLHLAVARALTAMGVEDVDMKYTHLQLGPSSALGQF